MQRNLRMFQSEPLKGAKSHQKSHLQSALQNRRRILARAAAAEIAKPSGTVNRSVGFAERCDDAIAATFG